MRRPKTFNDIKGHDWLVNYLINHISKGTLSQFLIIDGPEGLGKTSIADVIALSLVYGMTDSPAYNKAYETVVVQNQSNDCIKRFKCSVEGGKDAAVLIRDEMNTTFTQGGIKVLICDECHGLTDSAQDVFLSETEFLPTGVYVIMLTTESYKLKASLRSRAVPIHLNPLKHSDMVKVLEDEVSRKHLNIQNPNIVLGMIADWAECKPRAGLNLLNAFNAGSSVSAVAVRELIGNLDVLDVLPLLASLSGSLTFGLAFISEMKVNESIVGIVTECISLKSGHVSYKLSTNDAREVHTQLADVTEEQLIEFLYGLTKHSTLTRRSMINAYISAHASRKLLTQVDTSATIAIENIQRADHVLEIENEAMTTAPTFEDLLADSSIIKE